MPNFFEKPLFRLPVYGLIAVVVLALLILWMYQWVLGLILTALFGLSIFFLVKADQQAKKEFEGYISTLSYRVKKVGEEALMEMPIGIMLVNDQYFIEWSNPYLASCFDEDTLVGRSLYDIAESLVPLIKQEVDSEYITLQDQKFKVIIKREERLLYFFDVTKRNGTWYFLKESVVRALYCRLK